MVPSKLGSPDMSADLVDLKSSIIEQFGAENVDNRVVEKCKAICDRYDRNLKDFQLHLEAFILNGSHSAMTMENVGEFESQVHKETQKERINPHQSSPSAPKSVSGSKRHMTTPSVDERVATVFAHRA